MNTRDLFLSLLRFAIVGAEPSREAKTYLESTGTATLFKVAKAHDMAHLVAYAIEKCGIALSREEAELFKREKEDAILRYEMIRADLEEIFGCFDTEGIDYIPLKGAVLRSLYPEPWMRTSCDIDVLVKDEDIDRAVASLTERLSYKTDFKKTYHDVSLFSPFGMHLELHHNIKEDTEKYDKLLTRVWEFSEKDGEDGHRYLQTKEFLMLHLMCHLAYHFVGGGCGVRPVLDIWLLEKNTEFDDDLLRALLEEAGLLRLREAVVSLGERWFGSDGEGEADKLLLEMEKYILLGGVYGTKKQGAVSKQIKKGGRLKYFWSRLFMPYRELSILYPILKKHKILTPFCQVARWFGVCFKTKRIKREIQRVVGTSEEQINETKWLLNELGI